MVQKLFESLSVRTITPNGTPTSTLYLHNLDQQVFFPTEVLFFYKPLEQPTQDVVELLESSLKELLVSYHFAAGRCRVNEQEKRMELVCNHAGVPFAGASANLSIHDLGDLQTPNPMFRNFVLYPEAPSLEETPLLTVQVTKFRCGGFAVGICGNHAILDGVGLSNLFRDYSMIARGEKLTVLPNPDKTFLRPRPTPSPTFPHNELVGLPDAPVKFTYNPKDSGELSAKHTFKTFTFIPDMIQSLKNKVLSEGLLKRCSTLEVVTAHIWQARTKVMGLKPEEPSKLFLVVDFRKALKSLVPRGFPGNAVICAPCVETSSQEVCENSLAFCVDKVQRTIRNVTEEYIRSEVDWCEINHGVIDLPGGLLFTTWSKLGFEEIDFGWGKPAFAGPVVHNKTEFVVMFSNCQEAGALNLSVALEYDKMEEFEKHVAI